MATKKVNESSVILLDLNDLLLDPANPRLGVQDQADLSQNQLVDTIVDKFGVDDLLSSMSINGYFSTEPLVCININNKLTVVEGNRRLVSALILTNDKRARNQSDKFIKYREQYVEHGSPTLDRLPAIIFESTDTKRIKAYLGVRHIVSTKDWDSYAKAHWVHETVYNSELTLSEIIAMTGDQASTIKSLVFGYNFINQLEKEGRFNKENTIRKGRGSMQSYPFSFIYTTLGYLNTQKFLDLDLSVVDGKPTKNIIPNNKLDDAKFVVDALLGNQSKGQDALISDSRQIKYFTEALVDPEQVYLLKAGKKLDEVKLLALSLDDFFNEIFLSCQDKLNLAHNRLVSEMEKLDTKTLDNIMSRTKTVNRTLRQMREFIESRHNRNDGFDFE